MFDIRFVALVLAVIGLLGGAFLATPTLIAITILVLAVAILAIMTYANKSPGTSAGLGHFLLVAGSTISTIIPMWVAVLVKWLWP